MALIKRLFPKVSEEAIGWPVDTKNWPSTPYVAAVPWLKKVMDTVPEDAKNYANAVRKDAPEALRNGISGKIGYFRKLKPELFLNLDGNFYFDNELADFKRTPLEGTPVLLEKGEQEPEEIESETNSEDCSEDWSKKQTRHGLFRSMPCS